MFFTFKIAIFAAMASYTSATTYANFCDDTACSVNCGISVSTDNPGCLNETGRHSIKFHDANVQEVNLVFSPTPNCPCQNECIQVVGCSDGICSGALCLDLSGNVEAQSFRFVGGDAASCDPNNC